MTKRAFALVLALLGTTACGPASDAVPETTGSSARPASASEVERLHAEVADLQRRLDAADARLAAFEGINEATAVVHNAQNIPRKLHLAAKLPEGLRSQVGVDLGRLLMVRPDRAGEVLIALRDEKDPGALRVLADVIRNGALASVPSASKADAVDALRSGEPLERRLAAAWALQPGIDPTPPDAIAAAVERLRTETDAELLGVLAELVGGRPTPEALDALEWAARKMPPGADRRRVLVPVARASVVRDRGESVIARATEATAPDLRDDLAAAIAGAANSMSAPLQRSEPDAQRIERMKIARDRFIALYRVVTQVEIRRDLARAASGGLAVLPPVGPAAAERVEFYRAVAEVETDPAQKAALERAARGFEDGSLTPNSPALDAILRGR